jgi:hypothetical protein
MKKVKCKRPQKSQDKELDKGNSGWTMTGHRAAEGSGYTQLRGQDKDRRSQDTG